MTKRKNSKGAPGRANTIDIEALETHRRLYWLFLQWQMSRRPCMCELPRSSIFAMSSLLLLSPKCLQLVIVSLRSHVDAPHIQLLFSRQLHGGFAADTTVKVRASTVFVSYSLQVSIVGFFTPSTYSKTYTLLKLHTMRPLPLRLWYYY